jgi:hypothetical protein
MAVFTVVFGHVEKGLLAGAIVPAVPAELNAELICGKPTIRLARAIEYSVVIGSSTDIKSLKTQKIIILDSFC